MFREKIFLIISLCPTTVGIATKPTAVITMASPMPAFVSASESIGLRNKTIRIITTVTYDDGYYNVGAAGTEAIRLALNRLALQRDWLPGYNLEWEMVEDLCSDEEPIKSLLKKLHSNDNEPRFPIALLTECQAYAALIPAAFLKEFNFISQTIYENTIQLEKRRHKLPNYLGLGQRGDYYYFGLIALCKRMGWTKIALVSEIRNYYNLVGPVDSTNEC